MSRCRKTPYLEKILDLLKIGILGPLKVEIFKYSLKFRAIFENFEKDKKKRRFQFGGAAEVVVKVQNQDSTNSNKQKKQYLLLTNKR